MGLGPLRAGLLHLSPDEMLASSKRLSVDRGSRFQPAVRQIEGDAEQAPSAWRFEHRQLSPVDTHCGKRNALASNPPAGVPR
jgi:hypothetical protein